MREIRGLGIKSDVPFLDRLQRGLGFTLAFLFVNPISSAVVGFGSTILLALIFTHAARAHSASVTFRISISVILFLLMLIWAFVLVRFLDSFLTRLVFGPPAFGKLGGTARGILFAAIRCSQGKKLQFAAADMEKARAIGRIDREITEWSLKTRYQDLLAEDNEAVSAAEFETRWSEIWQKEILAIVIKMSAGRSITYGDALAEENFDLRMELLKLPAVARLVVPIMSTAQIVMLYLLLRFLDAHTNLLTVIQAGLFLGLLVCLVLFNFHAHQIAEVQLVDSPIEPRAPENLKNRLKELSGLVLRPTKITINKNYLTEIQRYFSTWLVAAAVHNTVLGLILVGIVLLMNALFQHSSIHAVLPWYRGFLIGLVVIQLGLIASYHLMFIMLRNLKLILVPIIVGLLAAFLPYGLIYIVGGHVNLVELKNVYFALATGLVTAISSAITSRIKKSMSFDDEQQDEDGRSSRIENKAGSASSGG
ncbi:MAG TPA: hypothetical protein VKE93_16615 [Candidatus Angelobacter sp.]|nr:hypothetical protein [Candidatus Angelobacter sp.]